MSEKEINKKKKVILKFLWKFYVFCFNSQKI